MTSVCPRQGLFDLPCEQVSGRYETIRHGGDGPITTMLCGAVRFEDPPRRALSRTWSFTNPWLSAGTQVTSGGRLAESLNEAKRARSTCSDKCPASVGTQSAAPQRSLPQT